MSMILNWIKNIFNPQQPPAETMSEVMRALLADKVAFYRTLKEQEKLHFEVCCLSFMYVTEVIGHDVEVSDEDRLLIASASVILAWGFPQWHYVKVDTVYLVSAPFNENAQFGKADSGITGLVGTHHLRGKMILSQSALRHGFSNDKDKHNVAIHEFAHLIDMADGQIDGLPEQVVEQPYIGPWLSLIQKEMSLIDEGQSDIREYGATNPAEFFSVVSEYFFERPKLLKHKHPKLYALLQRFYKQNRAQVQQSIRTRKKAPCPCGSGKRYKRCCLAQSSHNAQHDR